MEPAGKKILLAEDDQTLNFIISDHLQEAGFEVVSTGDGKKAILLLETQKFDLCLLDVMLPGLDGFSVAKKIRETDELIPILFLTARSMTEDRINGLSIGGDDYITKPFSMEELLLRIKVFLKRSQGITGVPSQVASCRIGKFEFDFDNLTLSREDSVKTLTYKEALLLRYFCEHADIVLSRSDILRSVWGSDDYYLGRSLDVFISRLRKYLKSDPEIRIINLHGIGFRFNARVETT